MAPKVVLITGCSSGIGLATAKLLASKSESYCVVATARNPSMIEGIAKECNFDVKQLDVTDNASVKKAVEEVIKENGRLDVLINNAGYGASECVEQLDLEAHKALFDTNYFGMVRTIQAALPHMRAARSGHIINVTSLVGFAGFIGVDSYAASKFAVEGLSECMAPLLAQFGISVSIVEPGPVETDFRKRVQKDIEAAGGPKQDDYTPIINLAMTTMRKSMSETPGVMQTSEQVAEVMQKVIEDAEPHLRYQTSSWVESRAREKFVDPTGDKQVKDAIKMFKEA